MQLADIEQALSPLPLGDLRYLARTGSTNDDAARWADAGASNLSLVVADEQIAGHGRLGRNWFTPPGSALAFSLILKDLRSLPSFEGLERITALGALGVCQTLRDEYRLDARIKWPNDVLVDRRKVCGVLTEATWQGEQLSSIILGIGVNVTPEAVPPEGELAFPATCVETALGRPVERLDLLRSILAHILHWKNYLGRAEFVHAWDGWLAFKGEWVIIYTNPGAGVPQVRQGQVLGLDEQGSLKLLDQNGKMFTQHAGEVRLRPV